MNRLCVVFLVVVVVECATSIAYGEIIKCCDPKHKFVKINGTLQCSNKTSFNSHIYTNTTNFLENNTDGQCVEFYDNFYIFNISKSVISQFKIVDEKKIYSKCCPLKCLYDTVTHRCQEYKKVYNPEIKKKFIKVGLPTCHVIVDEIVDNITEEFSNDNSNCVDRTTNGSFILRKCLEKKDVCWKMRCVKKCCPDGYVYTDIYETDSCTEYYRGTNLTALAIRGASEFPEDPFATIFTNKFSNRYFINESKIPSYLNRRGTFSYISSESGRNVTSRKYCLEYVISLRGYFFFLSEETATPYYSYIIPIELILLSTTIVIYFLLNEVKITFGKILVNYCLAILIWHGQVAYSYLVDIVGIRNCLLQGFGSIFGRFTVFVWSNILCLDIWRSFTSMTRNNTVGKKKQYKTIMLYSLYGWGLPAVLTLIIFLFQTYDDILPDVIQPNLGISGCSIESIPGNYSKLLFIKMPVMLLEGVNIVLFVKTTMYCLKVKNEINHMDDNADKMEQFKKNKAQLLLILKLLLIMGITFIHTVIPDEIKIVTPVIEVIYKTLNIIHASQGIFVFIIFICNRQIFKKIKNKLGIWNASGSGTTQSVATQSSTASNRSSDINTNERYTMTTM